MHTISKFRGWLLSNVPHTEGLDANPSPIEHGGMIWSSCTLRNRLRVVSGAEPVSTTTAFANFAIPSTSSLGPASARTMHSPSFSIPASEPQDYFSVSSALDAPDPSPPMPIYRADTVVMSADRVQDEKAPKVSILPVPPVETMSFTNECVLRAHSAGDVDPFLRERTPPKDHDVGFFDWTRLSISSSLPPHIQFARAIDWDSTPLGPIAYWSNDLRAMCNLIM
jgi:hypothetical protein